MRGKLAKELRRDARLIAEEQYHIRENSKVRKASGQIIWNKFCPKGVYKRLKREVVK